MNTLKYRRLKHYLPITSVLIMTGIILHFIWPKKDLITLITDVSGYVAIVLLSISLIIGAFNVLMKRKNAVSSYFRRDIGISGGILAVIHSITGLFVHMRGNMWQYFSVQTDTGFKIRLDDFGIANYTGILSALLIVVLLVTSSDYFISKLQVKKWKNIQRLSYPMFILAIIHVIYYRLNNSGLLYSFYLPMVASVLVFQVSGFIIRIKNKNASISGKIDIQTKEI